MIGRANRYISDETFDDFLKEHCLLAQTEEAALTRVRADQIKASEAKQQLANGRKAQTPRRNAPR